MHPKVREASRWRGRGCRYVGNLGGGQAKRSWGQASVQQTLVPLPGSWASRWEVEVRWEGMLVGGLGDGSAAAAGRSCVMAGRLPHLSGPPPPGLPQAVMVLTSQAFFPKHSEVLRGGQVMPRHEGELGSLTCFGGVPCSWRKSLVPVTFQLSTHDLPFPVSGAPVPDCDALSSRGGVLRSLAL